MSRYDIYLFFFFPKDFFHLRLFVPPIQIINPFLPAGWKNQLTNKRTNGRTTHWINWKYTGGAKRRRENRDYHVKSDVAIGGLYCIYIRRCAGCSPWENPPFVSFEGWIIPFSFAESVSVSRVSITYIDKWIVRRVSETLNLKQTTRPHLTNKNLGVLAHSARTEAKRREKPKAAVNQ